MGFDENCLQKTGEVDRSKRMKEDSLLLLRGFDSVAYSLSQLSNNLDNALQVTRTPVCFCFFNIQILEYIFQLLILIDMAIFHSPTVFLSS